MRCNNCDWDQCWDCSGSVYHIEGPMDDMAENIPA